MSRNLVPPNTERFWLLTAFCILSCMFGIFYAVEWGVPADGVRGGAAAVAATFLMLFLGHGTPTKVFEKVDVPVPALEIEGIDPLLKQYLAQERQEVTRINNTLSALMDDSKNQNLPLAISSVIGTLVAGFGDLIARAFGAS